MEHYLQTRMPRAIELLQSGNHVVLESRLIRYQDRVEFYDRVDAPGCPLKVSVLDAPRDLRRQRVRERNYAKGDSFFMPLPDEIFELASDLWQAPDEIECDARNIRFIAPHEMQE
ncbi:MAG: hypothetical protein WA632_14905 [Gallionella sp.]